MNIKSLTSLLCSLIFFVEATVVEILGDRMFDHLEKVAIRFDNFFANLYIYIFLKVDELPESPAKIVDE